MNYHPTALEVLAEQLEGTQAEAKRLYEENGQLRQELITANSKYNALFNMSMRDIIANYDIDVLVELSDQIARVFGLTKSENYRKRVREFLQKQREQIVILSL